MLYDVNLDDDQREVLIALAEHDGMTVDDKCSELLNDLLARIWQTVKEEFMN